MRSNHILTWTSLRAFLVVLMGIAFGAADRARGDEHIENISIRATSLGNGQYSIQVSCRVITDGPERNIYLRVTLWEDDLIWDDELAWDEHCYPARDWERRPSGNI